MLSWVEHEKSFEISGPGVVSQLFMPLEVFQQQYHGNLFCIVYLQV